MNIDLVFERGRSAEQIEMERAYAGDTDRRLSARLRVETDGRVGLGSRSLLLGSPDEGSCPAVFRVELDTDLLLQLQPMDATDVDSRGATGRAQRCWQQADLHLAAMPMVRAEAKFHVGIGPDAALVELYVAGGNRKVITGARSVHVAADRDRTGQLAMQQVADFAVRQIEVRIELKLSALWRFQNDRRAGRRAIFVACCGKEQDCAGYQINTAFVMCPPVLQQQR